MRQKIRRLRLEVVVRQIQQTTTSNELPSVEEEKQLRDLVEVIMGKLHKSVDAVQKKCVRLGLEVVDMFFFSTPTTTQFYQNIKQNKINLIAVVI